MCNVIGRISVNSFAAVFRKGVLEFVFFFFFEKCWSIFEARFQKVCGIVMVGFWTEFGVLFSRELHAYALFPL